ncbi:MAG: hypothetical protein WBQ11_20610, partial [Isosphaeraceae bacterium]
MIRFIGLQGKRCIEKTKPIEPTEPNLEPRGGRRARSAGIGGRTRGIRRSYRPCRPFFDTFFSWAVY